eukprot:891577-Prymnesium_polylepis.1
MPVPRSDVGGVASADIAFYFVHWLTDLAGAEPTPLRGAEKFVTKFPQPVFASLVRSIPFVQQLGADHGESETTLNRKFLIGFWPTVLGPPPVERLGPGQAVAVMRLVMQAQNLKEQQQVIYAFENLPSQALSVLVEEMTLTGCAGQKYTGVESPPVGPAFLVYYWPAVLRYWSQEGSAVVALCLLAEIFR